MTWPILALLIIGFVWLAGAFLIGGRYQMAGSDRVIAYKIDRFTGEVWLCQPSGKRTVVCDPPDKPPDLSGLKPVARPAPSADDPTGRL
jgi:hypothetical protein